MSEVEVYRHKSSGDEVAGSLGTDLDSRGGWPEKPNRRTPRRLRRRRGWPFPGNFGCFERGRQDQGVGRRYFLIVIFEHLHPRVWDVNERLRIDKVLLLLSTLLLYVELSILCLAQMAFHPTLTTSSIADPLSLTKASSTGSR